MLRLNDIRSKICLIKILAENKQNPYKLISYHLILYDRGTSEHKSGYITDTTSLILKVNLPQILLRIYIQMCNTNRGDKSNYLWLNVGRNLTDSSRDCLLIAYSLLK